MQFGGSVTTRDFTDTVGGGSFQSFVYAGRQPWSVAVYRAEIVNFRSDGFSNGPFLPVGSRANPFQTSADVTVTQYGVSGAFELGELVSVGVGVNVDNASVNVRTDRYTLSNADFPNPSAASFDQDNLRNFQTQTGDESDVGYTAGVRWHTPDETFSVGAVFKTGTEIDLRVQNNSATTGVPFLPQPGRDFDQTAMFHVPSRFGVGVAWKHDTLTVLFDYSRVNYSELTEDLAILFFDSADVPAADQAFQMDDGNEIRVGGEWGITAMGSNLIFVRGGVWLYPVHQLTFGDQRGAIEDTVNVEAAQLLFPGGSDEMHYTVGGGVAVGARMQVDVAYDYSELISSTNASIVFRF